MSKFKIGDIVKVSDSGLVFSCYEKMAKSMVLKYWLKGVPPSEGAKGKVVTVSHHGNREIKPFYGVEGEDGKEFIIGEEGLELYQETFDLNTIIPEGYVCVGYGRPKTNQAYLSAASDLEGNSLVKIWGRELTAYCNAILLKKIETEQDIKIEEANKQIEEAQAMLEAAKENLKKLVDK